jgi:DNA mismatch repair ATPase MutS
MNDFVNSSSKQPGTRMKRLQIEYNRDFGDWSEVTKANLSLVIGDAVRRQTAVNGEHCVADSLKEKAREVLPSNDRLIGLEQEFQRQVMGRIS